MPENAGASTLYFRQFVCPLDSPLPPKKRPIDPVTEETVEKAPEFSAIWD
jgi:DNA polymerase III epsilon subunit-like protein